MRSCPNLRIPTFLTMLLMATSLCSPLSAQQPQKEPELQPGELFLQGYLIIKDIEKLKESGQFIRAWEDYRKALNYYQTVSRAYPEWRSDLVKWRITETQNAINEIEPKAQAQLAAQKAKVPQLVSQEDPVKRATQAAESRFHQLNSQVDNVQNQLKLTRNKHQVEVETLKNQVQVLEQKLTEVQRYSGRESVQVRKLNAEILRVNEQMRRTKQSGQVSQEKLAAMIKQLEKQRNLLAAAPLKQDVDNLIAERDKLENELTIVAREHKSTVAQLAATKKENRTLMTDVLLQKKRVATIQKAIATERGANNAIVEKLKRERDNLADQLELANQTIIAQSNKISTLQNQLNEFSNLNQELKRELADVTQERDQLSELLAMNKSERVQQLIADNVRMATELKDAKSNLDQILHAKNLDQDEVIQLRSQLALSKSNYLALKRENIEYIKRVGQIEQKLAETQAELETVSNNPQQDEARQEEANLLKQTVQRLLTAQGIRRDQEELLWKTYKRRYEADPEMDKIFSELGGNDIQLSEQEKQLLAKRDADETLQFKNYASRRDRLTAQARLDSQLTSYQDLAKRFLERGNYDSAKDVFDQALELHPGDYSTLMNCGVVRYAMNEFEQASEFFQEGITMRENNAYTHYMLGSCQYHTRQDELAAKSFERAISIQPDYANAHLHLGIVRGIGGRHEQAIESFQTAIHLDPDLEQAYYNLSIAFHSQGESDQAKHAYLAALKKGFAPNPAHEAKIGLTQ